MMGVILNGDTLSTAMLDKLRKVPNLLVACLIPQLRNIQVACVIMFVCDDILAVQATNRQIWTVVNFILTVVGSFMFCYIAGYFANYSIPVVCI